MCQCYTNLIAMKWHMLYGLSVLYKFDYNEMTNVIRSNMYQCYTNLITMKWHMLYGQTCVSVIQIWLQWKDSKYGEMTVLVISCNSWKPIEIDHNALWVADYRKTKFKKMRYFGSKKITVDGQLSVGMDTFVLKHRLLLEHHSIHGHKIKHSSPIALYPDSLES